MTGTALTEAEEFSKIYKLEVAAHPAPTWNTRRSARMPPLVEVKAKDEEGYAYTYFCHARRRRAGAALLAPQGLSRMWSTAPWKPSCAPSCTEIVRDHVLRPPDAGGHHLGGTSERLSSRLQGASRCAVCCRSLLVRRVWMEANKREEDGRLIPELQPFNEPLEKLTPDDTAQVRPAVRHDDHQPGRPSQPGQSCWTFCAWTSRTRTRLKTVLQGGRPAPGAECPQAHRRIADHRRRGRVRRGDHRHQHGRPRCGHQAGRRTGRGSHRRGQPRAAQGRPSTIPSI